MSYKKFISFTLVELIIVITILAILTVSAFLVVSQWIVKGRDSRRLSDLGVIQSSLNVSTVNLWQLPMPDNAATIQLSWTDSIISYQWEFGDSARMGVDQTVTMKNTPKDPLDNENYIYVVSSDRKNYQIGAFLENKMAAMIWRDVALLHLYGKESSLLHLYPAILPGNIAAADYSARIFATKWSDLWILLLSDTNQPVNQTTAIVIISWSTTAYNVVLNNRKITWTGLDIYGSLQTLRTWNYSYASPSSCPIWFISVPWSPEFQQPGFCVAKYEMKYADSSNKAKCTNASYSIVCNDQTRESYAWANATNLAGRLAATSGFEIVSKKDDYPIAALTQEQAIAACKSLGSGYHLVTNKEWMTMARNIESQSQNRSGWVVWIWGIYRGLTNETLSATSLGCAFSNVNGSGLVAVAWTDSNNLFVRTDCQSKRQLQFSNGQIIWDLAGNVWEHVNWANTLDWTYYNTLNGNICSGSTDTRYSYAWNDGVSECSYINNYSTSQIWPGIASLNASNWIWRVWSFGATQYRNRVLLRWGQAWDHQYAWLYNFYANRWNTSATNAVGFRCAYIK